MTEHDRRPRIVLAVTASASLKLMTGFPEYLAGQGWDVHVVTSGAAPKAYPDDITLHHIDMVREPAPWRDATALFAWLWLLARLRPDVVVASTPKAGLLGMIAAWCLRVPARIYLLRGLRLETEGGLKRAILHVTEWLAARTATRVQSVSKSLRDEFVSLGLAPASKVVVLGAGSSNGVELADDTGLDPVSRVELGLDEALPVVGFVGRMTADKGLETLTEAIRLLREKATSIQFLLVGAEEPPGSLAEAFRKARIPQSAVCWVGSVSDARPYFRIMDILCLPTRREGFPNVVLEAAVQGVAAVVSDVTGARDSIIDGRTGLLFPRNSSQQLAAELERLVSDPSTLRIMGQNAKEHVAQMYDRQTVWRLNLDFLESQFVRRSVAQAKVTQ